MGRLKDATSVILYPVYSMHRLVTVLIRDNLESPNSTRTLLTKSNGIIITIIVNVEVNI